MKVFISTYFCAVLLMINVQAQDSSAVKTDSLVIQAGDLELKPEPIPKKKEEKKKKVRVYPWQNRTLQSAEIITNDSLLRWNIYPNWGDFYAYRNDAISFRRGTIGRTDAFNIRGYNEQEQSVWLDDIRLNNPVTGLVNYNYVPHHKIGKVQEVNGSKLNSYIDLRDYYINEPISYLNFDEAPNDYRNLEFLVAQNVSAKTNIEFSYWDRRDGGFFPNNTAEGSQVMARMYHHLGNKYKLEGLLIRNVFNNDESGGYLVNDPLAFGFGEFTSQPRSGSGSSEILRSDFKIGIYQRADTSAAESGGFILNRLKNDRSVKINSDTLAWELIGYQAKAFKKIQATNWMLQLNADVDYYTRKSGTTVAKSNWLMGRTSLTSSLLVSKAIAINLRGELNLRNTDHSGFDVSGGVEINPSKRINVKLSSAIESRIPNIQQLYWNSKNYIGNEDLENEQSISAMAQVSISLNDYWDIGTINRIQSVQKRVGLLVDSTFSTIGDQQLFFSSGFIRFQNSNFEIENSVAYETTLSQKLKPNEAPNNFSDSKLWIRNSLFYKTYAFNRATFLKMGVRALTSPLSYQSKFYNTELAYWQTNSLSFDGSTQAYVPAFFRLDAELSARVRAIMVVLRWENALDGVGQAGYFETSAFPMPPRRLIVGIRAQFRN